jgi:hypothetical protein
MINTREKYFTIKCTSTENLAKSKIIKNPRMEIFIL